MYKNGGGDIFIIFQIFHFDNLQVYSHEIFVMI